MKLLPCHTCKTYALHPPTKLFPGGMPAVQGRPTSDPVHIPCSRCGRVTRLSMVAWNGLPEMKLEDFQRVGLGHLATRDLEGLGVTQPQAADLFRAGLTVEELHPLTREAE